MKILVAVDGSETSQTVLKEVAARPWPPKTCIEVLNVVEPAHLWTLSPTAEEAVQLSAGLVNQAAEELRARGLEASGLSIRGDSKRVILDRAKETGADFVFVASGGASSAVLSHATCSVTIVRPREGARPGVHKILLATDGSEFSNRAAKSVAERPWPEGTEIEVLSVVELRLGAAQALLAPPYVDQELLELQRQEGMKSAQNAVASAVEILANAFPHVAESISVLVDGTKAIIIDEAEKWGADVIVMGSHGHQGIERFLLGSVSEGVALHAHCSVEVIR